MKPCESEDSIAQVIMQTRAYNLPQSEINLRTFRDKVRERYGDEAMLRWSTRCLHPDLEQYLGTRELALVNNPSDSLPLHTELVETLHAALSKGPLGPIHQAFADTSQWA